jgi:hypothetical protein
MPRRPIGEVAMTGAERMRRYRAKQSKGRKPNDEPSVGMPTPRRTKTPTSPVPKR